MATLRSIIDLKLDRLDNIPEAFNSAVVSSQRQILNSIIDLIGQLDVQGGFIQTTEANFRLVELITNQLGEIVFDTDYSDAIITFASEFDTQAVVNQGYYAKIVGNKIDDKSLYQNMLRVSKSDAVNLLDSPAIQNRISPGMKNILLSSVSNNQSFSELVEALNLEIIGDATREGSLLKWTKQIARDSYSIADQRYTNIIAEDLDFEWYQYSRGTVKDTRDFCLVRQGRFYHKSEIELWPTTNGSFQANPAPRGEQWQGRNPDTNSATIWYFRGGFNCLHAFLPVSVSQVPAHVIARIK